MDIIEVLIEKNFTITGRGIILELKHNLEGLIHETILFLNITGRTWKVKSRVLFDHAVQEQKVFKREFTDFMLKRFNTDDERLKSIQTIKEKETLNIYMYLIESQGYDEKPVQGEKLEIKT